MEKISIVSNYVYGSIPSSLGQLTQLRVLQFADLWLTGTIPTALANLRRLDYINLQSNILTGTIPQDLYALTSLNEIIFGNNYLNGTIPESSYVNMKELWLQKNQLSGPIPDSLYAASNLDWVMLYDNLLSGTLSEKVGNLDNMQYFDVFDNYINGTLPTELGLLRDLIEMDLGNNHFSGTIPTELGLLSRVQKLHLYMNELTGQVPLEMSNLSADRMYLFGNLLGGSTEEFCHENPFTKLIADCATNSTPRVECPCCISCCDNVAKSCDTNFPAICEMDKATYELEGGGNYVDGAGTKCECSGETKDDMTLLCSEEECVTCNKDGTICAKNVNFAYSDYAGAGVRNYYNVTFQYVTGLNDTVTLEKWGNNDSDNECMVTVNGEVCDSCKEYECKENDGLGFDIVCDNIDGVGSLFACKSARYGYGPLAIFELGDPFLRTGCPPRIGQINHEQ